MMTTGPLLRKTGFADICNACLLNQGNPFAFVGGIQVGFAKAMLEGQIELLDFLKTRYGKDIRYLDDLAKTQNPSELLLTASAFLQEALDDYSREMVKVSSYGPRLATDAAAKVQKQTEDLANEIRTITSVAA